MATQIAKEVQVIARVEFKHSPAVVYKVRSSDGKGEYRTTFYNGHCTSCTCKGYQGKAHKCYHSEQLTAREAARQYDIVGAALQVVNQAETDHRIGDFYEQRAKDIEETRRINYELQLGI